MLYKREDINDVRRGYSRRFSGKTCRDGRWKGIYKYTKKSSGNRNARSYYATVIVDEPRKVMCTVPASKLNYNAVLEGKDVIITKIGGIFSVVVK